MANSVKISAAIICFNEEDKISRCLNSLLGIADEIIVVDSFSTDKTPSMAQSYQEVIFYENKFVGHIEQKNFALSLCTHDVVLSLDADEVIGSELRDSILAVKKNFIAEAYSFNRLTDYAGFWVRHSGWYPDVKLRLARKDLVVWSGSNPHDYLHLKSNQAPVWLKGDLLHYSYDSISDHIEQTNKFTTIAAKSAYEAGTRSSIFKVITRPPLKFLKDYVLKRGFLDGRYGLIICTINALSAFLKYSKLLELKNQSSLERER